MRPLSIYLFDDFPYTLINTLHNNNWCHIKRTSSTTRYNSKKQQATSNITYKFIQMLYFRIANICYHRRPINIISNVFKHSNFMENHLQKCDVTNRHCTTTQLVNVVLRLLWCALTWQAFLSITPSMVDSFQQETRTKEAKLLRNLFSLLVW